MGTSVSPVHTIRWGTANGAAWQCGRALAVELQMVVHVSADVRYRWGTANGGACQCGRALAGELQMVIAYMSTPPVLTSVRCK
jgi:hypothetical protein